MKFKYFLFLICLTIISCKDTKKEYYENGKLKAIYILKDGVLIDSSIFYNKEKSFIEKINYYLPNDSIRTKFLNENGKVESTGLFFKNQKYGKWKYFSKEGYLQKVFEYKNIEGKQYTNQGWQFNSNGDTIMGLGNYYKLKPLPKSIKLSEKLIMDFEYKPLLSENSTTTIYMSSEINNDFSNLNSITLDTVSLPSEGAIIEMSFKSKGEKKLRGFIKESIVGGETTKSKYTYFDFKVIVE